MRLDCQLRHTSYVTGSVPARVDDQLYAFISASCPQLPSEDVRQRTAVLDSLADLGRSHCCDCIDEPSTFGQSCNSALNATNNSEKNVKCKSAALPHLRRWLRHVATYTQEERLSWPQIPSSFTLGVKKVNIYFSSLKKINGLNFISVFVSVFQFLS